MISPVSSYHPSNSTAQKSPSTSPAAPQSVDKNMFMRLMIAQLRNQDPLSPSDGTQFVAQLAQFQQLETSVNSGQDLAAMRKDLDEFLAALAEPQISQS
jgi:flagellar basal-body rod modification protein FlgD